MALGLILGLGRSVFRRKRTSSLDILTSKRSPRDYYKGKNCKPTGFHTRKGIYPVLYLNKFLSQAVYLLVLLVYMKDLERLNEVVNTYHLLV